jgi:hypothetical protein
VRHSSPPGEVETVPSVVVIHWLDVVSPGGRVTVVAESAGASPLFVKFTSPHRISAESASAGRKRAEEPSRSGL